MALRRYAKSETLKRQEENLDRCDSRHPNWHTVRCDRTNDDHFYHQADNGQFEWTEKRRGGLYPWAREAKYHE